MTVAPGRGTLSDMVQHREAARQFADTIRRRAATSASPSEVHFLRTAADACDRIADLSAKVERLVRAADRVRSDPGGAADADPA